MRSLLSALRRSPKPRVATVGERRVFAVGDVHGRLDQLERLLALIADDVGDVARARRPVLVFLGDYVDRGPDSRGVIERLVALKSDSRFETRTLKGNHEESLLAFLDDAAFGPVWAEYGGLATLASYGVAPPDRRANAEDWERARRAFAKRLPDAHLGFLRGLELTAAFGDYLFVHAGVRPGVPLEQQAPEDLLWIREPFLSASRPCDKVVVHGHSADVAPFVGRDRICVDTGAYATGVLTAVRLAGETRAIIQSTPWRAA